MEAAAPYITDNKFVVKDIKELKPYTACHFGSFRNLDSAKQSLLSDGFAGEAYWDPKNSQLFIPVKEKKSK